MTGLEKSRATPDAGLTEAPAETDRYGTRDERSVPYGTVTAIVCVASSMEPVAAGDEKPKAVIALAVDAEGGDAG